MAGHSNSSSEKSGGPSFPGVKAAVIWWLIGKFLAFDHRAENPEPSTGQAIADLLYAPLDRAVEHRVVDAVVGCYSEFGMFIKHHAWWGVIFFLLWGFGKPLLNKIWKKMMEGGPPPSVKSPAPKNDHHHDGHH
jgi:hypothetical protein